MTKILFVMETGLGHNTLYQNLQTASSQDPEIDATFVPITFDSPGLLGRIPKLRHDIVLRGGLQAYQKARQIYRRNPPDVLFLHTQMVSVFCHPFMRRTPTAISLDSTPRQFLELGPWYGLNSDPNTPLEKRRDRWYRRAFASCARLFPWSQWAADSLTADYGVPPGKIDVFPPGVELDRWQPAARPALGPGDPVRLLFVGGDFGRKGGDLLLRWMREEAPAHWSLDIVSRETVPPADRITVHRDLTVNDPRLVRLYRESDLFVLPTRADCTPLVLMEAMAAGLPVVATRVGGIGEIVSDSETGYLVAPDDYPTLAATLSGLALEPGRLRALGRAARARAEDRFAGPQTLAGELEALKGLARR